MRQWCAHYIEPSFAGNDEETEQWTETILMKSLSKVHQYNRTVVVSVCVYRYGPTDVMVIVKRAADMHAET